METRKQNFRETSLVLCLWVFSLFFFLKIYLFMAALGPHCYLRAFPSCVELWLLFVVVCRLLTEWLLLLLGKALGCSGFSR